MVFNFSNVNEDKREFFDEIVKITREFRMIKDRKKCVVILSKHLN